MHLFSCTDTHCGVTDLVNRWMVRNTKTWISWEQNIIFLQNKNILNLCFRWHTLRSYHFVAEVTFKVASRVQKIEVFKKGWNFASCSCLLASLQVASWKNIFSWKKGTSFFPLIFTMNYLLLHWGIWMCNQLYNFARTFLYF